MSKKQYNQANGQVTVFGRIEGLASLVEKPIVIEVDGLKVISVVVVADNETVPDYTKEALKQARALLPEVKSQGKPPWMNAEWQARRRKNRATR